MAHVRTVLDDLGENHGFRRYVAGIRERHKRRRNLVKLLDQIT